MEPNTPEPMSRPVDPAMTNANSNTNTPPPGPLPSHTAGSGSTPLGAPASNVGRPRRGKTVLATFLILILLGVAGSFGYLWWQQRQQISTLKLAQADKDAAEQKVADLEKQVKELKAAASPSPSPTPKTDAESIIAAARAYAPTAVAYKADATVFGTPKISKKDSNFASVGVTVKGESGGYSMILKKVNNTWTVIVSGLQNVPSSADISLYGIPNDMP